MLKGKRHLKYSYMQKLTPSRHGGGASAQADSTGRRGGHRLLSTPPRLFFFFLVLLASAKNATQSKRKQKAAKTHASVPERDGWVCGEFLRGPLYLTGQQRRPWADTAMVPGAMVCVTCEADVVP